MRFNVLPQQSSLDVNFSDCKVGAFIVLKKKTIARFGWDDYQSEEAKERVRLFIASRKDKDELRVVDSAFVDSEHDR